MNPLFRCCLVASAALFLTCYVRSIQPEFKDSNQLFIEETVKNIQLEKLLKAKVPPGSKLALVSLETPYSLDVPIIATIEDQLIFQMVRRGFNVMERDQHAVFNLIKEKRSDYFSLIIPSHDPQIAQDDTASIKLFRTQLESCDYLVMYRILECGLIYRNNEDDKNLSTREGIVRLHVRIVDTESGRIVVAGNLTGKHSDTINSRLVGKLANFHYSYFPYEYPLQNNWRKIREDQIRYYDSIKEKGKEKVKQDSPPEVIYY
jgi:hypothetical protein